MGKLSITNNEECDSNELILTLEVQELREETSTINKKLSFEGMSS